MSQQPKRRTFSNESQMMARLLPALEAFLCSRNPVSAFSVRREVGAGATFADAVALLITEKDPGPPLAAPRPLSGFESVVVSHLRRRGPTPAVGMASACGLPPLLSEATLRRLRKWGIVRAGAGGEVMLEARWLSSVRLVAIEAKLIRWRDAIAQAEHYRNYADEAYVVLPKENAAVAAAAEFEAAGVGLLVFDGLELDCRVEPPASTAHDWPREFVYSRLTGPESRRRPDKPLRKTG